MVMEAEFRFALAKQEEVVAADAGTGPLLGFPAADFLDGKVSLRERIHPDDADIDLLLFDRSASLAGTCNLRVRHADGRIRCVRATYAKREKGGQLFLDLKLQDAKGLTRTLSDAAATANFRAMMENTDDFIYFKDRNHVFTGASQTLVALCDPAERWTDLLGKTDYDVFPEAFADIYYRLEKQVFAGIPVAREVQAYLAKDGRPGWVDNRKYPIHDEQGEIIGLFGIARDITERIEAEERIRQMAQHDSLTGLPNRALFDDLMVAALAAGHRDRTRHGMMFLDLDRFKPVNDQYGHRVGDLLLQEVAVRLRAAVRESDTPARIGGDEFVVLLRNIQNAEDALRVAEKILAVLRQPFVIEGRELRISASIGVAIYPEHGATPIELAHSADDAMYRSKEDGRDMVTLADPGAKHPPALFLLRS